MPAIMLVIIVEVFRLPHDDLHRRAAVDPDRGDRGGQARRRQEVADRPAHQAADDLVGHRHLGVLFDHRRAAAVRPDHPAVQWRPAQLEPHHRHLPLPVRHFAHEARLRRRGQRDAVHRLRDRRARLPPHPLQGGAESDGAPRARNAKRRRPSISPVPVAHAAADRGLHHRAVLHDGARRLQRDRRAAGQSVRPARQLGSGPLHRDHLRADAISVRWGIRCSSRSAPSCSRC